jgi:hypothetical protein
MIIIDHKKYSEEDVRKVFDLVKELLTINEELNANIVAFDAKLKNEEKKVKDLQYKLWFLTQQAINKYEA